MKLSVLKWSRELGCDRETLAKRLVKAGLTVKAGSTFTLKEVVSAYYGDDKRERTRLLAAQADKAERLANVEALAEQLARATIAEVLGPVRAGISSLPALAPRCNPADPATAAAVLEARSRELLEASQTVSGSVSEPVSESRKGPLTGSPTHPLTHRTTSRKVPSSTRSRRVQRH